MPYARALAAAALVGSATVAQAEILGVEVTAVDFSSGYLLADGTIHAPSAPVVSSAWSIFQDDWTTYRLWATVDDADAIVAGFVGSEDDAFNLALYPGMGGVFFNETIFGGDTGFNTSNLITTPELAFDSFLALGTATDAAPTPTILDNDNLLQGLAGTVSAQDFGVISTSPGPGVGVVSDGGGGFRVLLGQFTVEAGSIFSGQGRLIGGGQTVEVSWTTDPIPAPGVFWGVLAGLRLTSRRRKRP